MLNKISNELCMQNITFDPDNQRVRCLAHVINLIAKKLIDSLYTSISYENEYDFEEVTDTENNLRNTIYKVNLFTKILKIKN